LHDLELFCINQDEDFLTESFIVYITIRFRYLPLLLWD